MPFTLAEQILLSALLPTAASRARLRQLCQHNVDWRALVTRAEALYLAPLLRFNLAQSDCLTLLPDAAQQMLEQSSQTWAARHLAYAHEAERLCTALADAGIRTLPLKGAALMLGGYYPQAGLRPAIDIDLLVDSARVAEAEQVAAACGYAVEPGRTKARARQRLPNELNHTAPRRGANGLLLELHTRAFFSVRAQRELELTQMAAGCGAAALALHLVHHTLVDLQSTRAILRTLADLHFILQRTPSAVAPLRALADEYGFRGAVEAAVRAEHWLASCAADDLADCPKDCVLLLETALLTEPQGLAAAARLVEYFDLAHAPWRKLGNLGALVFTNREHLTQQYGTRGNLTWRYVQRPFVLLRKFAWAALRPSNLRRVWQWRKLAE